MRKIYLIALLLNIVLIPFAQSGDTAQKIVIVISLNFML